MDKDRKKVLTDNAFRNVMRHPPERVKQTLRTRGKKAAKRQAQAIALDEVRRLGIDS